MTKPKQPQILSYADRLSVAPGEPIEFKVSSVLPGAFHAELVRLVNGDRDPAGPGFQEVAVTSSLEGSYPARFQGVDPGSMARVDDAGALALRSAFTVHAFISPTTPDLDGQVILGRYDLDSHSGYALELGSDGVALRLGLGQGQSWRVASGAPLYHQCWYSVFASYDPVSGRAAVSVRPVVTSTNSLVGPIVEISGQAEVGTVLAGRLINADVPFTIAAATSGERFERHYNGKIEQPAVWGRVLTEQERSGLARTDAILPRAGLLAHWDFAANITRRGVPSDVVLDSGPLRLNGTCVNQPARAMTGCNWDGDAERFTESPSQYGAIHFHDDDLDDCGWDTDITWIVPDDLPSGTYALKLTQGDEVDRLPVFVLPPRGRATAEVLFVAASTSYLAYANEHMSPDAAGAQAVFGGTPILDAEDLYLHEHRELGLSMYDLHNDGSGVMFSSARRPLVNLRPDKRFSAGGAWQFPADLRIIDWLEHQGITYDVVTDLEVHQEGAELLSRYRAVLTGSHPEYVSSRMLDGFEAFLAHGGRLMYLGANGFYWAANWHPEKPWMIELRRNNAGVRGWQAGPGEFHLQTSGQKSGLWRDRNRPPQKLVGTGFATQGLDFSSYFTQSEDARDPRAAWIFDGVGPEEKIGDFGLDGGGSAGFELDRYDLSLGTPPEALLLAYSTGLTDNYPRVPEEIYTTLGYMGATMDYGNRGDIVFYPTTQGGAVFSVSSIAWAGGLSHNDYTNNVSLITGNVLKRFLDATPLDQ